MNDFRRSMMPESEDRDSEPAEQAGRFLKQDMPKHKQESRFGKNERITKALKIAGADTKAAKESERLLHSWKESHVRWEFVLRIP